MEKTKTPSNALSKSKKTLFLEELRKTGDHKQACEAVSVATGTPYQWSYRSVQFAEAFRAAREEGDKVLLATLEAEIKKRALAGPSDPGSTNLLMFRTKRLDPLYRENATVNVRIGPASINFAVDTAEPPTLDVTPGKGLLPGSVGNFAETSKRA